MTKATTTEPPPGIDSGITARRLMQVRGEILSTWEARAREQIPAARTQGSLALRNSLPGFLDELAILLASPAPRAALEQLGTALAVEHGQERAAVEAYTLDQMIGEYRLLRQVTLEVLERDAPLSSVEREVVLDAVYTGMANAAREFTCARDAEREAHILALAAANENLETRVRQRTSELARNEQLFRGLVEGVRDYAVFTIDVSGYITTWNAGAERMKQYTAQEIIGAHFSVLYPEEGRRRDEPMSHLRAAAREGRFRGEGVRVRKNGEHYLSDVLIVPMYEEGKLFGFSKVVQDLTERTQLLQERDLSRLDVERLHSEQVLRDNFVASITHDLRSPLQAARTAAEMITDAPGDTERVRDWASRMKRIVLRMDSMVTDLLDASRARAGVPLALHIDHCDLKEIAEQARDEMADVSGHRIVVDVDGDTLGWWSAQDLRRVLDNLLSNAVKYGAADQPITARIRRIDDRVIIAVHNHGTIIGAEDQRKLFAPFHRSAEAAHSGKPGWGLGLALVRGIVDAHGGAVKVESYPIQGTTFTVDLPVDARAIHKDMEGPSMSPEASPR